jgi:Protein of unknown function (DUF742)
MGRPGDPWPSGERWVDEKAGHIVRPYALVRGRTQASGANFDVVTIVTVARRINPDPAFLEPEHLQLLCLCPATVADLADELRLPLAVVRVILSDLRARGFVRLHRPVQATRLPDTALLRRVADGLRRL